ncbi:MAG: DUF6077 domain-containing protein [Pseudomonadota bacterium]
MITLDRLLLVFVAGVIGVLGSWAVVSQIAVFLGAGFAPMIALFGGAILFGVLYAGLAARQPALFIEPGTIVSRASLLSLGVMLCAAAAVLASSFIFARESTDTRPFFLTALLLAAVGVWTTRERDRKVGGSGIALTERAVPVALYQRWVMLGLTLVIALLPLMLHRADPDDGNFLNLSVGMMTDPRPVLTFDTMIEDRNQPIGLPTYRVETYHVLVAVLSDLTGLSVIETAHLVLPVLTALLLFAIFALFCRTMAGHGWLIALIAALVVIVALGWSHRSFGNYAFVRLQHGKSLLFLGVVPLLYVFALRFWHSRSSFDFGILFLAQAAAVALSANGLYLAPLTVFVVGSGLLIFEPRKFGTYVLLGLSCVWPVVAALSVILTVGALPSEFTMPVPTIEDIDNVYGGRMAVLMVTVLAGWMLLEGLARRFFLGVVLVVSLLVFNPFLAPAFAEYVTGNLNWRLMFVLPMPLLAGLMAAAALERVSLSRMIATFGLCGLLMLASVAPPSIFHPSNRVFFKPLGLDVHYDVYGDAATFAARLDAESVVLAPRRLSTWLATFEGPIRQIAVRDVYLQHYRHTRSAEDIGARLAAFDALGGALDDAETREVLRATFERFPITDVILLRNSATADLQTRVVEEAGFVATVEGEAHVMFSR